MIGRYTLFSIKANNKSSLSFSIVYFVNTGLLAR